MFSLEQDPDQEPEAWHNQKSKCINMYQRLCAIPEKKIKFLCYLQEQQAV